MSDIDDRPATADPAPQPQTPSRQLKLWHLIAACVAVLAVAAGVFAVVVSSTGGSSADPSGQQAKTFTLNGSIDIRNDFHGSIQYTEDQGSCQGSGGFSDLAPGTAVKVSDTTGHVVATGQIDVAGNQRKTVVQGNSITSDCILTFTAHDVPDGLSSYILTISHRGDRVVSSTEAHAGVDLVIGQY